MPPVVAAIAFGGATLLFGFTIGTAAFLGGAVIYAAYTMSQVPEMPSMTSGASDIKGRTQVIRSASAPHRVIYGKCLVSGVLTAAFSTGTDNKYIYLVVVLASHEVQHIGDVYLGDTLSTDSKFGSLVTINKHLGTATQAADADLIADAVDRDGNHIWTAAHRLRGRAYLVVKLEYDQTVFSSGIPNIKAEVLGINDIYDPRTATHGYTDNAVLCQADFLQKPWGVGCPYSDINEDFIIAGANICDEDVPILTGTGINYTTDTAGYAIGITHINLITGTGTILAGDTVTITTPSGAQSYVVERALDSTGLLVLSGDGLVAVIPASACSVVVATSNSEKRYTLNGSFTLNEKPIDIMKKMLTASAGKIIWSQGKYSIYPAAYNYPDTIAITESDLRGDITVMPAQSRQHRFNTVRGTFVSPVQYWQQVDFPLAQDSAQYTADGTELAQALELPYTISASTAQRLALLYLRQNLFAISVELPVKLTQFHRQPGDVILLTIAQLGWADKQFVIIGWKLSEDGGVDLTLKEENPAIYSWTTSDQSAFIPPPQAFIVSSSTVAVVSNLQISEDAPTVPPGGIVQSEITLTWTNNDALATGYIVQFNGLDYATTTTTSFVFRNVIPGNYDFGVIAYNASNARSEVVELNYTIATPALVDGYPDQADAVTDGFLGHVDWRTFYNKQEKLSGNIVYYCSGGTNSGLLGRGNSGPCPGGTWIATSLEID